MPTKPIADKLRDAIARAEKRGITRYRIAHDAGVAQQTVANIINGGNPRIDVAERVANAIGYDLLIRRQQ